MQNQERQTQYLHKNEVKDLELIFSRVLNAPRELVFDAWTKPEHLAEWWGPNGFTLTTKNMEVKPEGSWSFIMHGPDGRDFPNKIIYIEVKRPERLVYRHSGDEGTEPVKFHVTVSFDELDEKTRLTMHMIFDTAEELTRVEQEYGAIEGAKQTLARLEQFLEKL